MSHNKIIASTIVGNILEYYDFMLFTFFISILSPLFFPAENSTNALLLGFTVFALGFFARPIGALIFGTLGDKWGRKKTLSLSILLMAIPTALMGLIPTYEQIGLLAPLALVICRVLQGLAAGGEVNGAAIFALEHTPLEKRSFWGSVLTSSAGLGALLATVVGALFTLSVFPEWAWRIPFILGGALGFAGYYIRKQLVETPEFEAITPLKHLPIKEVLQHAKQPFVKALAVGALINVPFYAIVGYMNPVLHTKGFIEKPEMMLMNTALLVVVLFILPVMGRLGDRLGYQRVMSTSCYALILTSLITFWVFSHGTIETILVAQILFLASAEGYVGPSNGYLNQLFPPQYRYTGVAFASCLGTAICAGTTPLICTSLAEWVDPTWGPALYIIGLSVFALGVLRWGTQLSSSRQSRQAFSHP
jgi:MHS family proline/betaine transporter-like MFS transporter